MPSFSRSDALPSLFDCLIELSPPSELLRRKALPSVRATVFNCRMEPAFGEFVPKWQAHVDMLRACLGSSDLAMDGQDHKTGKKN